MLQAMRIKAGKAEAECLRRLVALARAEDLGGGDVTAAMVPEELNIRGHFVARQELVVCGAGFLADIAAVYDRHIRSRALVADGRTVASGAALATWEGPARAMLSAERVALNFLQHLSGVATATRRCVDAVADTGAKIYDTRKTTPGWRALDKYAVRCGGGHNHRMGLYDAVLVKDNHLAALAAAEADDALDALAPHLADVRDRLGHRGFVEVEVDRLDQLRRALKLPVDAVLLDNMTGDELRQAVALRDAAGLRGLVALEASGGVTPATVRAVAETGVERISVGALTHSPSAVDIALDVEME